MFEENKMSNKKELSVILPLFNEEENVPKLYPKLKEVLDDLKKSYEVIFIDDGSVDNTFAALKKIHEKDNTIKIIKFRKNFGQSAAIAAGFEYAKGEIIITLDGDLQNDPADIPSLLAKIDDGYDVISGWRRKRKDPLSKKIPSRISNWLARYLTKVNIHDFGCTLKAYNKEAIEDIELYGEMHRYIPALLAWKGFKVGEVEVSHHPRRHGKPKYGVSRLVKGFMDLITVKFLLSYSTKPLHIFGTLGAFSILIGLLSGAYLSFIRLAYKVPIADRPLLLLSVLLIFLGAQFISMGLLGEIMIRIYYQNQNKSVYSIEHYLE